jgi:subtilisin family serine protease
MFKKTILASAIALSSQVAVANDADIIANLKSESNSIVNEFVDIQTQVVTDARIDEFNAFDGVGAAARSNYEKVASFSNENLRIKFAKIYIRIYENALKRSYRLIDRVEGFKPRLRDRIKGMSFYKSLLDRVAFYEAEVAKYKSLLVSKVETGRDIQVTEKTNTVVSEPVLVNTQYKTESVVEEKMQNTYEVVVKTFDVVTTTTLVQVTTTTISFSDNTSKVEVAEKVLSKSESVAQTETTERTRLLTSVPVDGEEVASEILTDEFYGNYALDMIGADVAYEQGYTGAGVQVGVVDTGLTDMNNKFSNIVNTYNIIDGTTNVLDDNGHGTHVAGIIGANKNNDTMHGVAYNADLTIIKALDANGSASHRNLAKAINWSVDSGAQVTNVSVAGNLAYNMTGKADAAFDYFYGNLKPMIGKDSVVVVAAGNSGLDCKVRKSTYSKWEGDDYNNCAYPAALPQVTQFKDLEGQWIAVGAVDSTGEIAKYSNKAGVMKDWYILAPGSDVLSTSADGGFEKKSGTSMAAPVVTGAFALLAEKFPHLTGTQVRSIIFQTADDLGEVGVDEVYGNGLLNVGRAMAPIGDLTLPNGATVSAGSGQKVESSAVVASAGMASAIASSVKSIGVLDSYDRVYKIDATPTVYSTASAFAFENYQTVESNNIIFGLNRIQNDIHSDMVLGYKFNNNVSLTYGQEKGAFGSVDTDLVGFGIDSTDYVRVGYTDGPLNLNLDYGYAAGGSGSGVIKNTSDLHGMGFSVNYTSQFKKATHTIGFSSPVKVENGHAEVETLTSRNVDGTLNYSSEKVDLSNSDREYMLTNSYTERLSDSSTVRFNHSAAFGDTTHNAVSVSFVHNF